MTYAVISSGDTVSEPVFCTADRKPMPIRWGRKTYWGSLAAPLTGTPVPTGARFAVVAKSPLTGGWGDANCGGRIWTVPQILGV
jgi:hypothetical protein